MFCRIYTCFKKANEPSILRSLARIFKGELKHEQYIEKNGCSLEITINDEFSYFKARDFPDGFLFFTHTIELDIEDDTDLRVIISDINGILTFLWENLYPGVAACDFEDQLIENGGYKSKEVPWISKSVVDV